ncbi:serine hydrolase domain-containing protein [Pseudoalteromonas rubra]|uniref:serine hydrolase domain-containing protein n=1 Tax=Pseudoalteromonas rubra TaxID=43658 RepID=UPI002DB6CDA5|nr:serine hydrolase [Pseudoalteromonas rubra]MEC4088290.1 serine hydrolase [Pseudoalteromonas rubra]
MARVKYTLLLPLIVCSFASISNEVHLESINKTAPTASAEEAIIQHWRQPDINREFWDISVLPQAFIDVKPAPRNDGLAVGELGIDGGKKATILALADELAKGQHGNFDSLLIHHKGKLVFESYYLRGRVDLSHPQSSVTKAYTGMLLGRAMQLGYLSMEDLDKPVAGFLNKLDAAKFVDGASHITLHQALTMTTGLRISDATRKSLLERPELVPGQKEIQFLFEHSAPITPESKGFYYDIGPQLIMQVLAAVVPGNIETFIKTELLGQLNITNFAWKTAPSGLPESIWRSSLTSRDMIKMGILAANKGKWKGKQIINRDFMTRSTSKLITTGDDEIFGDGKDVSNQGYGYYWWSSDLQYEDKKYSSVSAQGGGGIYIILIEELDLIIAITAHHVDHATQQIVAEQILPAFID